ncbi:putative Suppressor of G2 allele of SKP1 [Trypanosoma vivax]|nr:phosphatase-like protein [Trypanosoma vivax]KAH8612620.1 putative Suppressor of G2 allele of SKP1 [Trypanosoma vivax]
MSASAETKPFNGTVRSEWFQSLDQVTFTFYVRERLESDVRVRATERSLSVAIKLDSTGREYEYNVKSLYDCVKAEMPVVRVLGMKVEVVLTKKAAVQWPALEALDGVSGENLVASMPTCAKELPYPNSRGRDWNAVKLNEEDPEPQGEQALNALFQKIYGNGTDEQRRAMMKSFVESNGTVLSTNWEDVGSRYVKTEPPSGTEAKKMQD